jgi:hypothetical protein
MTGSYDCHNKKCRRYHEVSEARWVQNARSPRCLACRRPLRLLKVKREMPEKVKAMLRGRKVGAA